METVFVKSVEAILTDWQSENQLNLTQNFFGNINKISVLLLLFLLILLFKLLSKISGHDVLSKCTVLQASVGAACHAQNR